MQKLFALFWQFVKFGFVGGICFLFDYGLLALFREVFQMPVLFASGLSFTLSTVLNYFLSMRYVFQSRGGSKWLEFLLFAALSAGGLGINQLIMWLGTGVLSFHYLLVKLGATAVVLVYNFLTRKGLLEKHDPE